MPAFDLKDLAGQRVTSQGLRGKPTLINFYFAQCVPCILEVGPLNGFAASRGDLNFLAVTFDEPPEARAFVNRYKFRWRVVPDARDFIDRMAVNRYPMMALFDANGRLLGMRAGGVKDELEAAAVAPRPEALGGRPVAAPPTCQPDRRPAAALVGQGHDNDAQNHRRGHRRQPLRPRRPAR